MKKIKIKGEKKKIEFLNSNNITLLYYCENASKDDLACCCGDKLGINSNVYLFEYSPKGSCNVDSFWAGIDCGRRLISLSNQYNGTNYKTPLLLKTVGLQTENDIALTFHRRKSGIGVNRNLQYNKYTTLNKELMVGVYLLCCWKWKNPAPDRLFAKLFEIIYENPDVNVNDKYIVSLKPAIKGRNIDFEKILIEYRNEYSNAFPDFEFRVLTDALRLI